MLARWILNGPIQALGGVALMSFIPGLNWVAGAVLSLVALRKTMADALLPTMAALIIAGLVHWPVGDVSQVGMVLATLVGSLVLANTRSLDWAVVAVAVVTALYVAGLVNLAPEKIQQLVDLYQPMFELWSKELSRSGAAMAIKDLNIQHLVIEGIGLLIAASSFLAILLARWVQSRLFNPGGFRQEFHLLRMKPAVTLGLAALLFVAQVDSQVKLYLPGLLAGYFLAGLALAHGVLGNKPNRGPLILFFYLGLLITTGFGVMLVMVVALLDSFVNFRHRIRKEV